MLASAQAFVQRRYYPLLMAVIGLGFLLVLLELILYRHFRGLQLIGTITTALGALLAFVGIGANARLRTILAGVFLALALVGLIGAWEHNEDRFKGERGERTEQAAPAQARGDDDDARQGSQPGQGGERGQEPPPLAPLSLSGFCVLSVLALLGKKDELSA